MTVNANSSSYLMTICNIKFGFEFYSHLTAHTLPKKTGTVFFQEARTEAKGIDVCPRCALRPGSHPS